MGSILESRQSQSAQQPLFLGVPLVLCVLQLSACNPLGRSSVDGDFLVAGGGSVAPASGGSCSLSAGAGTENTASQILAGYYGWDSTGASIAGSMTNRGTWTLTGAGSAFPGAGYYSAVASAPAATNICSGNTVNGVAGSAGCIGAAGTGTIAAAGQICSSYYAYNASGTAVDGSKTCLDVGTPSTISGLRFWLNADAVSSTYSNGATAPFWRDYSSYNYDVYSTSLNTTYSTAAIGTKPAFTFSGANCMRGLTASPSHLDFENTDPFTVIGVFRPSAIGVNNWLVSKQLASGNYNGWYVSFDATTIGLVLTSDSSAFPYLFRYKFWTTSIAINTNYIFVTTTDGVNAAGLNGYMNGTALAAVSASRDDALGTIKNTLPLMIGARESCNVPMTGKIGEILIYSKVLSTVERESIECYLSTKYGIAIGHSC